MVEEIWLPQIDKELCIGCGDCIITCPTGALALENSTAFIIDPAACIYNGGCEITCPVDAITLPYQIILESDL